ncbi:MAG: hypothetical protein H7288_13050 [Kineosporiaceae bacterium]|nr:hypothetical protein [Aeromicrobium sp.]
MSKLTGMPVTNSIYPTATVLNADHVAGELPTRIHNLPITYLASLVHQAGSSGYLAWVYVNVSIALVIAVTIYFVAKWHGYSHAYVASALFLSFPLTAWLSMNALVEMSLALGSCLLMVGATIISRADNRNERRVLIGLSVVAAGTILMFYTRDNYILLFPALAIFTFWVCRFGRKRWLIAVPILGLTASFAALKYVLLPQYPTAGLLSTLMTGTSSNKVQMASYYDVGHVRFSVSELILKAISGTKDALLPSGPLELITELPIIVIVIAALVLLREQGRSRPLLFWMAVVAAIYLGTAAVFQAQNRYIFALVPFAAVFGVGLMDRLFPHGTTRGALANTLKVATASFLLIGIVGSFLMARAYRAEATTAAVQTDQLSAVLADIPGGPVLTSVGTSKLLPLTYAATPRPVLAVNPKINSATAAAKLIETWDVRVLVGSTNEDFQYCARAVDLAYGGRAELVRSSPPRTPGGPVEIWLIKQESAFERQAFLDKAGSTELTRHLGNSKGFVGDPKHQPNTEFN